MTRLRGEGTIRVRKDERWEVRVRFPDGTRKSAFAKTEDDARVALLKLQTAAAQQLPMPSARLTVEKFVRDWLTTRESEVRANTYAGYRAVVENHIVPHIGKRKLAQLTPREVQAWLGQLQQKGLAPRTIQLSRTVLRSALQRGVEWGDVQRNVADVVRGPRVERAEVHPWDGAEAAMFLNVIQGDRFESLYIAALTLGLRQGELLGLRWRDIDLKAGELRVVQARIRGGKDDAQFGPPKSRQSRRALSLPAITLAALKRHHKRQLEDRVAMGKEWKNAAGLVFTTGYGTPLDGVNVGRYFQRHVERAGLRRVRFHDLRHSAASILLAQGVALRTVMEILGHSQISLTANTYAHIAPALKQDAAMRMDAAFALQVGGQVGGQTS